MSITVGTPTVGAHSGGDANGYEFDFTVDSGTDLVIFGLEAQFAGGGASSHIGQVTWDVDDSNFTKLIEYTNDGTRSVSFYAMVNPEPGTGKIIWPHGNLAGLSGDYSFAVNLTGNFYSVAASKGTTKTSASDNPSESYAVSAAAGVVFDGCMANNPDSAPDGGQTSIFSSFDAFFFRAGASYEAHAGSNPTLSYTASGAVVYAGVEIIESYAPAPNQILFF